MNYFKFLLLSLILSIKLISLENTPSARFLKEVPWEKIEEYYEEDFPYFYPLLKEVIQSEKEEGFLCYHASTQNFRIYQDIIRSVLEEKFNFQIPLDFYFFRIPGEKAYDLPQGADSYFKKFARKPFTHNLKSIFIKGLVLDPLSRNLSCSFPLENLNHHEKKTLWKIVELVFFHLDHIELSMDKETLKSSPFEAKNLRANVLPHRLTPFKKALTWVMTHRLVENQWVSKNSMGPLLRTKFPYFYYFQPKPKLDWEEITKIINKHQTHRFDSQEVENIFQLEYLLESVNKFAYSHFPPKIATKVESQLFPYWDVRPEQAAVLVSLNIPLFGNYRHSGESTLSVFIWDSSITGGDLYLKKYLRKWFKRIGLSPDLAYELFDSTQTILKEQNQKGGCLLQLFDPSLFSSFFIKKHLYPSLGFGIPLFSPTLEDLLTSQSLHFKGFEDPQLRLVMSNQETLNPYGCLRIKRYDLYGPEIEKKILNHLQEHLRNAPIDPFLRAQYLEHLRIKGT